MQHPDKQYKYFDIILGFFVAVLLISNVASTKIVLLGPFTFDGGTLLFPLSYIFGDILTEVYGYARSRRVIWTGFFSALVMSITLIAVGKLPPAPDWPYQQDYLHILGLTPRIVLASLVAYFCGEFTNSYTLARLKLLTHGRYLWIRTIGSTLLGEGIDTLIFILIAFGGVFDSTLIWSIFVSNYIFKVGIEIIFTPLTYWLVNFLKREEDEDFWDYKTNFNPFLLD
jgi:uncharacterized integral membrane protein (TIGR00697 family)